MNAIQDINTTLAREIMGWKADMITARDGSIIVFSDRMTGGTIWNPAERIEHAMLIAEELADYPWSYVKIGIDHDSFNEKGGYWCKFPPVLSSGVTNLLSHEPCTAYAETMAMAICKAAMRVLERKNPTTVDWTWNTPVFLNDTVHGSTEDGWGATIQLVEGKGWHVMVTLRGEMVYGSPCFSCHQGMFQAQELRKDKSK